MLWHPRAAATRQDRFQFWILDDQVPGNSILVRRPNARIPLSHFGNWDATEADLPRTGDALQGMKQFAHPLTASAIWMVNVLDHEHIRSQSTYQI